MIREERQRREREAEAETLAENIERIRAKSKNLAGFAKEAWAVLEPAAVLKWGWALDAICDHLEAVTRGDINRLLINVPPGSMKSLLVGVIWPAWEWGPLGLTHLRYLGTSHKEALAVRDNLKCRRLIQSQWYQAHWPTTLTTDQNAKTKFENDSTGFREAMAFTSMTGSRGDRVILDDPLAVDDANSPTKLQSAALTFTEALPSRVNNEGSAIIVVMQRIHQYDTSGIIIDNDLGYVHLCIPMEYETDTHCSTEIGYSDPRTVDGELFFEERFSAAEVAKLKKSLMAIGGSYAVSGQLQQRPSPRGGGMFQRTDFKIVQDAHPKTRWVRGWDLAASETLSSAYTAGVKMGKQPDGSYIVGHVDRAQAKPSRVRQMIKQNAAIDGKKVPISIPQDPGQAGKAQAEDIIRENAGYAITASPETGDKVTRATPLAAQAEIGNVHILAGDWNKDFLDEITLFPAGKFMDQVDGASRAFNEIASSSTYTLDNL